MQQKHLIFIFLLIFANIDCKKKDACANEMQEFNISAETKAWLPDEILTDQLKFKSEDGEIITLQKEPVIHSERDWTIYTPCGEDDTKDETILYESTFYKYSSGDSIIRILNSLFENNQALYDGGAIYASGFISMIIGNSTKFQSNRA